MEDYIAIIIFLLPGFIVAKVHELLGNKRKYKSDIKTVTEIIGYDILIFTIQIIILRIFGYKNINDVVIKISEFKFLLKLTLSLACISLLLGAVVAFLRPQYTGILINILRKKIKKPPVNDSQVWDTIINKGPCFMKIEKDGQLICKGGIVSANFSASDERELLLANGDLMDLRPELFDEKTMQVYYNMDKDLVIKIYDPAKVIAESQRMAQTEQ